MFLANMSADNIVVRSSFWGAEKAVQDKNWNSTAVSSGKELHILNWLFQLQISYTWLAVVAERLNLYYGFILLVGNLFRISSLTLYCGWRGVWWKYKIWIKAKWILTGMNSEMSLEMWPLEVALLTPREGADEGPLAVVTRTSLAAAGFLCHCRSFSCGGVDVSLHWLKLLRCCSCGVSCFGGKSSGCRSNDESHLDFIKKVSFLGEH